MKKLLFILAVIGALAYFGFIDINEDKVKSAAKTGLNTTVSLTKKVNTAENRARAKNGLTRAAVAAKQTYEDSKVR